MRRGTIFFALATSVGCAPPEDSEVPATYEGEHVLVYTSGDNTLCAGSMAHMDAFVERLSAEFGLEPPRGDERIRFHWLTKDSVKDACGAAVAGCAPDGEVFSRYAPLDHELVHAVAAPFGLPRSLFAEGLAVTYEDIGHGPVTQYFGASSDVLALVEADQIEFSEQDGYRLAGAFTSYLIERFGIAAYLGAYAAIDRYATRDEVDSEFRRAFHETLEDTVADFQALLPGAGSQCNQPGFGAKLMECAAPELAWDGEHLALERSVSCSDPASIGPFDDKIVVLYTLTLPSGGTYELRMDGDDRPAEEIPDFTLGSQAVTGVSLHQCGGCTAWGAISTWIGSTPQRTQLPAGTYSLRLHAPAAEGIVLGFSFSRIDSTVTVTGLSAP